MSVRDGIGQTPCSFEHYLVEANKTISCGDNDQNVRHCDFLKFIICCHSSLFEGSICVSL